MTNWTVTTTKYATQRYWGARFDWLGLGYVLHIGMSRAPAMRICLFGCAIWFGKIPPKPQVITETFSGGIYAATK
jgi:hypothetical protein